MKKYDVIDEESFCGRIRVQIGMKYGFIDENGYEVIPCIYNFANIFIDGIAEVNVGGMLNPDSKWGAINVRGEIVIPLKYTYLGVLTDHTGKGYNRVVIKENSKYGLLDYSGKTIVPCEYDGVSDVRSNGKIEYKKGNEHGFMDINGNNKEILPF